MAEASTGKSEYRYTNFLINEKSPYLLQHAHNPVNWHPWGDIAFEKAKSEDKPIFLSIGYSTCHWCHVMEKESFSNPDIAAILNKHFIAVKVDREERPDIDKIYMAAAASAGWGGGWPLSMWLTPDLKPFYGGTYFPPDSRWGRPGFPEILEFVSNTWQNDRERVLTIGNQLTEHLESYAAIKHEGGDLDSESLDNGFKSLRQEYDSSRGGFNGAPKFPMPVNHNFLLRYYAYSGNEEALNISRHTLREMGKGGIYDHIGGGFHRYSTDAKWHIPHFEKMLYDNAQIAVNYLDAYQITKEEQFAKTARETLNYVLRDMTHPEGGFFSAEDADSLPPELAGKVSDDTHEHKSEGAFYLWEKQEVLNILGDESGEIFSYRYGINKNGNAESDPHGEFKGKNIPYIAYSINETAKHFKKSEDEIVNILEEGKKSLFEFRNTRPRSGLDDKILISWNGLMISAFARASQVLNEPKYAEAAKKAAQFIQSNLYADKKLFRRWREGHRKGEGLANDYAFLVQGLIDLYEASFDIKWLNWAIELTEIQNSLFYDVENGGFYMTTAGSGDNLLLRMKEDVDNVQPSASSVASLNLLRLSQLTDRADFREAAENTLSSFANQMKQQARSLPQMLVALNYYLSKPQHIIILGDPKSSDTHKMLEEIHKRFAPNKALVLISGEGSQRDVSQYLPFIQDFRRINGKATAYICVDYTCSLPTSDIQAIDSILDGKR